MPEPFVLSQEDIAAGTFIDDRQKPRGIKLSQEDIAGGKFMDGEPTGEDPDVQPGGLGRYVDTQTGQVVNGRKLEDGRIILAGSETTTGQAALLPDDRFKLIPKRKIGAGEAFGRQAVQGVTLGFADEIAATVGSAFSEKSRKQLLGEYREADREAVEQQTGASIVGGLTGMGASALLPGVKSAPGAGLLSRGVRAGLVGAAGGVGYSNAGSLDEAMRAAITGGAIGALVEGGGGAVMRGLTGGAPARVEKSVQGAILRDADQKAARQLAGPSGEGTKKAGRFIMKHPGLLKQVGKPKKFEVVRAGMLKQRGEARGMLYDAADAAGETVSGQKLITSMEGSLSGAKWDPKVKKALQSAISERRKIFAQQVADIEITAGELDDLAKGLMVDYAKSHPKIAAKALQFQLGELRDELKQSLQAGRKITLGEVDGAIGEVLKRAKKLPRAFREEVEAGMDDLIGRAADKKGAYRMSHKDAQDFVEKLQREAFDRSDSAAAEAARSMSMNARDVLNDSVADLAKRKVIDAKPELIRQLNDEMSILLALGKTTKGQLRRAEGITKTAPTSISDIYHTAKGSLALPAAAAVAIDPFAGAGVLALQQAGKAAPGAARKVNMALSNLVKAAQNGNATAQVIQKAIEDGVPRVTARKVVQAFTLREQPDLRR